MATTLIKLSNRLPHLVRLLPGHFTVTSLTFLGHLINQNPSQVSWCYTVNSKLQFGLMDFIMEIFKHTHEHADE